MAFERCAWSLTEGDLEVVARGLGRRLPAAFVDHYLLVSNGGWPPEGRESSLGVHGFHPITHGALPVERLIEDMGLRRDGVVDEVPFAYDAGGNQFLLVLSPDRHGQVDVCLADGWERRPTGLTIDEFLDRCHADFGVTPPDDVGEPGVPELTDALTVAIRTAVTELFARHPAHRFYYLTLVTTEEVHPPYLSAWSREALAAVPAADRPYLTWSYADSPFHLYGAQHFAEVRRLLGARQAPDADGRQRRLDAMEAAVDRLDREGLFGRGSARSGLVVAVEVMPPDHENTRRVTRLNPPEALVTWLAEAAEDVGPD
ncbi:DUF4303 domain-containing protein [Micromonospora echinospora]|uniref:DUF4303 domain-containing protein n=1 Tax=Micromonospora echinospora TaxID=1877 RepID=UPI0033FB22B5